MSWSSIIDFVGLLVFGYVVSFLFKPFAKWEQNRLNLKRWDKQRELLQRALRMLYDKGKGWEGRVAIWGFSDYWAVPTVILMKLNDKKFGYFPVIAHMKSGLFSPQITAENIGIAACQIRDQYETREYNFSDVIEVKMLETGKKDVLTKIGIQIVLKDVRNPTFELNYLPPGSSVRKGSDYHKKALMAVEDWMNRFKAMRFSDKTPQLANTREDNIYQRGVDGENEGKFQLQFLPKEYEVIHNVVMQHEGLSAENDHVIIGPPGIILIETKNYHGKLYVRPEGWVREINGKQEGCENGLGQSMRHKLVLQQYLNEKNMSEIPVYIGVAIADRTAIIEGSDPRGVVLKAEDIASWILSLPPCSSSNIPQVISLFKTEFMKSDHMSKS